MSRDKEKHPSLTLADCNAVVKYVQQVLKTGSCSDHVSISEGRTIRAIAINNGQGHDIHIDASQVSSLSGRDFNTIIRSRIFKGLNGKALNGASFNFSETRGDISSVLSNTSAVAKSPSVPPMPTRSSAPPPQF